MLRVSAVQSRQAVAHFTFKSFHARQKILLTPQNISSIFKEKLDGHDRLLRQSSVGAGASRFLILDKKQGVRGVYHPILCLPYPAEGAGVLGLPVEEYLKRIESKLSDPKEKETPTVLVVVSHANGLGIATFAIDGSCRLPLVNMKLPAQRKTGKNTLDNARDMLPFAQTTSLVDDFAEIMKKHYVEFIHPCASFFFLTNENSAIAFNGLRKGWKERGFTDLSPMSLEDKRWVQLPDMVALLDRKNKLYRIKKDEFAVDDSGLAAGVKVGVLELDS